MCLLRCIRWCVGQSTTWLLLVSRSVFGSEACMYSAFKQCWIMQAVLYVRYAVYSMLPVQSRYVNAVHACDKDWLPFLVTLFLPPSPSPSPFSTLSSLCSSTPFSGAADGVAVSWGWNDHGMCGDGTVDNVHEPKPIPNLTVSKQNVIGTGAGHSFAIITCWYSASCNNYMHTLLI